MYLLHSNLILELQGCDTGGRKGLCYLDTFVIPHYRCRSHIRWWMRSKLVTQRVNAKESKKQKIEKKIIPGILFVLCYFLSFWNLCWEDVVWHANQINDTNLDKNFDFGDEIDIVRVPIPCPP